MRREFEFQSTDREHTLHGYLWEPEDGFRPKGILQIVHGMCEHIGRYEEMAEYFAKRGYAVGGHDHIGHGLSVKDGNYGDFGKPGQAGTLVRDTHQMTRILKKMYPDLPITLFGHSMGSFIAKITVIRYPESVDRLILSGTGEPKIPALIGDAIAYWTREFNGDGADSPVINRLMQLQNIGAWLKDRGRNSDSDWISSESAEVNKFKGDPLCGFAFNNDANRDLFTLIQKSSDDAFYRSFPKELPVLLVGGKDDPVGEYGFAPNRVARKLKMADVKDVEVILYDGNRHEVHKDRDREKLFVDMQAFMRAAGKRGSD